MCTYLLCGKCFTLRRSRITLRAVELLMLTVVCLVCGGATNDNNNNNNNHSTSGIVMMKETAGSRECEGGDTRSHHCLSRIGVLLNGCDGVRKASFGGQLRAARDDASVGLSHGFLRESLLYVARKED